MIRAVDLHPPCRRVRPARRSVVGVPRVVHPHACQKRARSPPVRALAGSMGMKPSHDANTWSRWMVPVASWTTCFRFVRGSSGRARSWMSDAAPPGCRGGEGTGPRGGVEMTAVTGIRGNGPDGKLELGKLRRSPPAEKPLSLPAPDLRARGPGRTWDETPTGTRNA